MACRAVRQRPLYSFQMVLQQNATIVGDAVTNSESPECGNKAVNKRLNLHCKYDKRKTNRRQLHPEIM